MLKTEKTKRRRRQSKQKHIEIGRKNNFINEKREERGTIMTEAELTENEQSTSTTAASSSVGTNQTKCTLCPQKFDSIQDVLKHELLNHSNKNLLRRPHKTLHTKIRTILKSVNDDELKTLRSELHNALQQCEPGNELSTIIRTHRMDSEKLEMVYVRILTSLQKDLQKLGSGVNIHPFGSIASGLALRDCDIDLFIELLDISKQSRISSLPSGKKNNINWRHLYNKINSFLRASMNFEQVYAIRQARVPIIKCKHISTGFSLDINVSCPSSVYNTNFMHDLVLADTRIHELFLFLKIWAKELKLIGPGNMTSYCLITLIIFYLQQPNENLKTDCIPILPAIKDLQSQIEACMVIGVNYAYNLQEHMQPIPAQLTVLQLIEGFFTYYANFDFEKCIISPYLGTTIPVNTFRNGQFKFKEYENQLQALTILYETPAQKFPLYHCMRVQDPFCLNHNVAASMSATSLDYFRNCMKCAQRICSESQMISTVELYERLLYSIIEDMACITRIEQSKLPKELVCRFIPTRAELRALTIHTKIDDMQEIHKLWVKLYIDGFKELLTEVYLFDLQSATPSHLPKHERLENADRSHVWLISGNIDTWSGRLHQRNIKENFLAYQLAQTREIQRNCRLQSECAVNLNAVLTINIICDYTAIELILARQNPSSELGISKNDPLRKFFNIFRCSIQNWKLNEKLQSNTDCTTENEKYTQTK